MPAAIRTADLTKHYGRTVAVERLTLEIPTGAAVALFGPNGAGKTTLLRLCATLLRPTSGSVELFGVDPGRVGAAVRRRVGVLAHESFLYPELSATENLLFYARLFGVDHPQERMQRLFDRLGLVGWAHRPVRTLSRGLAQRCALARALLHQPDLIILDEPFSGLDFDAVAALQDVLREVHAGGATLLMSTHDVNRGLELCATALVLVDGRLAFYGPVGAPERSSFEAEYHRLARRRGGDVVMH